MVEIVGTQISPQGWQPLTTGWPAGSCQSLAMQGRTVLAASHAGGVMRLDLGLAQPAWEPRERRLRPGDARPRPLRPADGRGRRPPTRASSMVGGPLIDGVAAGVRRSDDGGETYRSVCEHEFAERVTAAGDVAVLLGRARRRGGGRRCARLRSSACCPASSAARCTPASPLDALLGGDGGDARAGRGRAGRPRRHVPPVPLPRRVRAVPRRVGRPRPLPHRRRPTAAMACRRGSGGCASSSPPPPTSRRGEARPTGFVEFLEISHRCAGLPRRGGGARRHRRRCGPFVVRLHVPAAGTRAPRPRPAHRRGGEAGPRALRDRAPAAGPRRRHRPRFGRRR